MDPFRNGAAGVARSASPIGRSLNRSSAKLFRPEDFAELTTITASRSRFAPSSARRGIVRASSIHAHLLRAPYVPRPAAPFCGRQARYRVGALSSWSRYFSKRRRNVGRHTVGAVVHFFFGGFFFSFFGLSPLPMAKSMP